MRRRIAAGVALVAAGLASACGLGPIGAARAAHQRPAAIAVLTQSDAVPGPVQLPHPGTYLVLTTTNGARDEVVTRYAVGPSTAAGTTVTVTQDDPASGGQQVTVYAWRPDGIYLLSFATRVPDGPEATCVDSPAALYLKLPLRGGDSWTGRSSCVYASSTIVTQSTGRVLGTAWQSVGGSRVATYVVQVTSALVASGSRSQFNATSTATLDFDPASGMVVHELDGGSSWLTAGGKPATSVTETSLTSLLPV